MQKVKLFVGVDTEVISLEREINRWIAANKQLYLLHPSTPRPGLLQL